MSNKKRRLNFYELWVICNMRNHKTSQYSLQGSSFRLRLTPYEWDTISILRDTGTCLLYNGGMIVRNDDIGYVIKLSVASENKYIFFSDYDKYGNKIDEVIVDKSIKIEQEVKADISDEEAKIKEIIRLREESKDIVLYDLAPIKATHNSDSISVSLLSDVHIDEMVTKDSTLGKNEYNKAIAKDRLDNYFINLVKSVSHHQRNYNIKTHILGILGDIIGGYIHEELKQTNTMSPLEAISLAKSSIISGLKYMNDTMDVDKIKVICVVGNHGRTTDRLQFANMTETSYEYFMYEDIKSMCEIMGLSKIEFIIPKAGMVIQPIFDKRVLFSHGNLGFSYKGGIGGLSVPFQRWFGKMSVALGFDFCCMGHYHTSLLLKEGCFNGSLKGYDAYALNKGLPFEQPQQALLIFNSKRGINNYQPIYV